MCTVLILNRVHPQAPLIIAANRDEFYVRPTAGPQLLRLESPRVIGGRDLEHGGTWMGLNDTGLVGVLTNMRSRATHKRSRGEIVLDALSCSSPAEVESLLRHQAGDGEYRPFNLLYGNTEELHVAYHRDDELTIERVDAGVHVLPSGGRLDDTALPKVARGLALLEEAADVADLDGLVDSLFDALADHQIPSIEDLPANARRSNLGEEIEVQLQAICVHTPVYGTRSSSLAVLGRDEIRYYYSEGPACEGKLERVAGLLRG